MTGCFNFTFLHLLPLLLLCVLHGHLEERLNVADEAVDRVELLGAGVGGVAVAGLENRQI